MYVANAVIADQNMTRCLYLREWNRVKNGLVRSMRQERRTTLDQTALPQSYLHYRKCWQMGNAGRVDYLHSPEVNFLPLKHFHSTKRHMADVGTRLVSHLPIMAVFSYLVPSEVPVQLPPHQSHGNQEAMVYSTGSRDV